jgi:hypothetical protein
MHELVCICMYVACVFTRMYACTKKYEFMHVCMRTCVFACMYVCKRSLASHAEVTDFGN